MPHPEPAGLPLGILAGSFATLQWHRDKERRRSRSDRRRVTAINLQACRVLHPPGVQCRRVRCHVAARVLDASDLNRVRGVAARVLDAGDLNRVRGVAARDLDAGDLNRVDGVLLFDRLPQGAIFVRSNLMNTRPFSREYLSKSLEL